MRVVKHWNGLLEETVIFFSFIALKIRLATQLSGMCSWAEAKDELIDLSESLQTYYCHAEPIHMVEKKSLTVCLLFLPLNTHLLQTLSVFGTLFSSRDAIPAFKEIIGFGQKVEHKCSITISNAQG